MNYAYFRDKVICFEYLDIFPGNFIQVGGFFFNFVNFLRLYMSIYLYYVFDTPRRYKQGTTKMILDD